MLVSVVKAGKLSNGFERDKGKVIHLVEVPSLGSAYLQKALCGAQPSIQWSEREGQPATCPKCLKRLNEVKAS